MAITISEAASRALSGSSRTLQPTQDHLRAARILLGSYRTGEANDPDVYIRAVVAVLAHYPAEVAVRVAQNLPQRCKWLPNPAEIRSACEDDYGPTRRALEFEARSRVQLAKRTEFERREESPEHRLAAGERILADYRHQAGIAPKHHPETVDQFLARVGVSRETFDALPDLPRRVADSNPERTDDHFTGR